MKLLWLVGSAAVSDCIAYYLADQTPMCLNFCMQTLPAAALWHFVVQVF